MVRREQRAATRGCVTCVPEMPGPGMETRRLPLLVGASRKRFIDKVSPAPPDQRLGGSIAAHVLAILGGAAIIRTHDVAETVQALRVAAAIRSAR